jgi:hypothetical protein
MPTDIKVYIELPHDARLLPDNDQWTNRFQIKSESSNRLYTIAQNKQKRHWACNCMGWIRHRTCKHLRTLELPCHSQPFEASLPAGNR